MTLGREQDFASGLGQAEKRRRLPVIDLASQSSLELCSPTGTAKPELSADQQFAAPSQQAHHAGPDRSGAKTPAVGIKRHWGDVAADDTTLIGSRGPMQWGAMRPRARRVFSTAAETPVSRASPIVVLDDDSPATLSSSMKQQLQLQSPQGQGQRTLLQASMPSRGTPVSSQYPRPTSIAVNPSIAQPGTGHRQAAPPADRPAGRRVLPRRAPAAVALVASAATRAGSGFAGQRRNSNSSGSSAEAVDVDADAALARKLLQEEEDHLLAQRLMQEEEERASRERIRARAELEALQAAAGTVAAPPAARRRAARWSARSNMPAMDPHALSYGPGYEAADAVLYQPQREQDSEQDIAAAAAARAAAAAATASAHQRHGHRSSDLGQFMAQMLLSLPVPPRFVGGGQPRRGAVHGRLSEMRDAVLAMQRAGLPPHLLFSDRDFTADDYEALCRLDETVENRKGASASSIEALPTQTVARGGLLGAAGERLSCAVCLEEFVEGAQLRTLPCTHKYHKDCIDTWLRQKSACPVCNRDCSQQH